MPAQELSQRALLKDASRIVVKVGSSVLASLKGGVKKSMIENLVRQLATLHKDGRKVVLVSSGAVAAGCAELGFELRPTDMPVVQAAAAVGQCALMQMYHNLFKEYGITVAQVLLTRDGLHERQRFLHARNTMMSLLELDVIPIVNENDTVAVEELKLRVGDNDALAVSVTQMVGADCLLILSDVPGLYDRPPSEGGASLITHVEKVDDAILAKAGGGGPLGMGGMQSKVAAAVGAGLAAIPLVVAAGNEDDVVLRVLNGEKVGTYFKPRDTRLDARQQWIAFGRKPSGTIFIDDGAVKALIEKNTSLLAIGVRGVDGDFAEGDTVRVVSLGKKVIARGLSNFPAEELRRIAGKKNEEHGGILGYDCPSTVMHRDNLVLVLS